MSACFRCSVHADGTGGVLNARPLDQLMCIIAAWVAYRILQFVQKRLVSRFFPLPGDQPPIDDEVVPSHVP